MKWKVIFYPEFEFEFDVLTAAVQDELLAHATLLQEFGPSLGRPHVDTLNNSKYANMKEIRFKVDGGVWRIAFAFDLMRDAVVLVAGNKSGKSERLFYKQLIKKADQRYEKHLSLLEMENAYIN
ncbi:MAG: type II toxin-antitoxin system RelE/ParE family toxin [Gammaproteobacteria bacterium]|nr:type II toxin-antitoxin system RelE/ParE family toxin [Gammaproteobacteria bacterium]